MYKDIKTHFCCGGISTFIVVICGGWQADVNTFESSEKGERELEFEGIVHGVAEAV